VRQIPRRLAVVLTLTALAGACAAGSAWGQAQPSDAGGADKGESASAWHGVLAFGGWILLAVVVFGGLLWMALGRRGDDTPPDAAQPAGPAQAPPPPSPAPARRQVSDAHELTVLTFDHIGGAERAYADARGRSNDAPWLREVVFVECHRHGRIVVRGTFAGHYLDVDDVADAIWHDSAVGAVPGAVVGVLFDEIRREIPEGSSGIVALVSVDDSAALIEALHERAVRRTHHRLSAAEAAGLQVAVAQAPPAATPDV
jgi:hypothetical protein